MEQPREMSIFYFDHDYSKALASEAPPECLVGPLRKCVNSSDDIGLLSKHLVTDVDFANANKDILANKADVCFIHTCDIAWDSLLSECKDAGRSFVRVSSSAYSPRPLDSLEPLGIRLNVSVKNLVRDDLERIAELLRNPSNLIALRSGDVPTELKAFFQLVRPDYLAGFLIAGVASLVAALNSPDHDARFALALDGAPADGKKPSLRQEVDKWLRGIGYDPSVMPGRRLETDNLADRSLAPFQEIPDLRETFTRECGGTILPELDSLLSGNTLKSRHDEAALFAALQSLSKELHVEH